MSPATNPRGPPALLHQGLHHCWSLREGQSPTTISQGSKPAEEPWEVGVTTGWGLHMESGSSFPASDGSQQSSVALSLKLGHPLPLHCPWPPPSVRLCPWLRTAFLQRHQSLDLGPTPIQYDFILTQLHLQRHYFQIKSHSEGPGGHEFGRNTVQLI